MPAQGRGGRPQVSGPRHLDRRGGGDDESPPPRLPQLREQRLVCGKHSAHRLFVWTSGLALGSEEGSGWIRSAGTCSAIGHRPRFSNAVCGFRLHVPTPTKANGGSFLVPSRPRLKEASAPASVPAWLAREAARVRREEPIPSPGHHAHRCVHRHTHTHTTKQTRILDAVQNFYF